MNKYTKPTITLLSATGNTGATSTCSTSTADAKEIIGIYESMGIPVENAFAMHEACEIQLPVEGYCKFTSSIQVFFS